GRDAQAEAIQLVYQSGHVLHDHHFVVGDLGHRLLTNNLRFTSPLRAASLSALPKTRWACPMLRAAKPPFPRTRPPFRNVAGQSSISSGRNFCSTLEPRCGAIWFSVNCR